MKRSQLNLSSVAIASLAFLLNWLVFVDSAPLATLAAPFEVDSVSQGGGLLPIFPPDKTILDVETPSYTIQLVRRSGAHTLNLQTKADGASLIRDGIVQVIDQGDRPASYRFEPTQAGQPTLEIHQLSDGSVELRLQKDGQPQIELGR